MPVTNLLHLQISCLQLCNPLIPKEFISPLDETISIHYVLSDQELIDALIILLEEDS